MGWFTVLVLSTETVVDYVDRMLICQTHLFPYTQKSEADFPSFIEICLFPYIKFLESQKARAIKQKSALIVILTCLLTLRLAKFKRTSCIMLGQQVASCCRMY